ncbi:hypothetical protein AB1Y20_007459 [Prymnesium parvum]|uniref:Uncharacterized protein n=1 Tax=Prymnesium parvum TaxID=97485 RepID=A0AB34IUX5_PRYPA
MCSVGRHMLDVPMFVTPERLHSEETRSGVGAPSTSDYRFDNSVWTMSSLPTIDNTPCPIDEIESAKLGREASYDSSDDEWNDPARLVRERKPYWAPSLRRRILSSRIGQQNKDEGQHMVKDDQDMDRDHSPLEARQAMLAKTHNHSMLIPTEIIFVLSY